MDNVNISGSLFPGFQSQTFGVDAEKQINNMFNEETNKLIMKKLMDRYSKGWRKPKKSYLSKEVIYKKEKEKKAKRRASNKSRKTNQHKQQLNKFQR